MQTCKAMIWLLLMLFLHVCEGEKRPPDRFNIQRSTRRITAALNEMFDAKPPLETIQLSAKSFDAMTCATACYAHDWCRATNANAATKECELYHTHALNVATELTSDHSFTYVDIKTDSPLPFGAVTGFPTGSRLAITFRAAWNPLKMNILFMANTSYIPFMMVVDQDDSHVIRMATDGGSTTTFDNGGGFPFDEESVFVLELVKQAGNLFAININGAEFSTFDTPLDTARITEILIEGDMARYPFSIQLDEA